MKALILSAVIVTAASAQADTPDLEASLTACMAVAGDRERLSCFEAVTRGLTREIPAASAPQAAAAAPTPTPAAAPPAAAAPAAAPTSDFGQEHKPSARQAAESMSARVVAVKRAGYGELRVTLDNGQVWEQVGTERYQLRVDDAVVIDRASFNSFFLRRDGSTRKVRFTRLE